MLQNIHAQQNWGQELLNPLKSRDFPPDFGNSSSLGCSIYQLTFICNWKIVSAALKGVCFHFVVGLSYPFLKDRGINCLVFRHRSIVVLLTDWKLDGEWKSTIRSNPPRFARRVIPYCTFPCCSSGSPQACKKGSSSVRRSEDGCTATRGAHTEPRWSVSKAGYAWDFCRLRRDSLVEAQKTARATNNFSYYFVLLVDQLRSKTYCMFYIRGHFILNKCNEICPGLNAVAKFFPQF